MKCNVGAGDRIFRFIVGIVIAVLGIVFQTWWGLIAIIPLGTALFKFCPLYVPLKISTEKKEKS